MCECVEVCGGGAGTRTWRCADSLALRAFLGYRSSATTPEHSTLSVIRRRLDVRTHRQVFRCVAVVLVKAGLVKGLPQTVDETLDNLVAIGRNAEAEKRLHPETLAELVLDKGYHGNAVLVDVQGMGTRTYVAGPDRGAREWEGKAAERKAVYANRRRVRGARGKRLMRKRGEYLERPFAHSLETGGMRRVCLRGAENILKRLLIHVAGLNLGLLMRKTFGLGTPRGLQGLAGALLERFLVLWACLDARIHGWVRTAVVLWPNALRMADSAIEAAA